jgi:hypothetical protein
MSAGAFAVQHQGHNQVNPTLKLSWPPGSAFPLARVQVTVGAGTPLAAQLRAASLPSNTLTIVSEP